MRKQEGSSFYSGEVTGKKGINIYWTIEARSQSIKCFWWHCAMFSIVRNFPSGVWDRLLHAIKTSSRGWRMPSFRAPSWDLGHSHTWNQKAWAWILCLWCAVNKQLKFHLLFPLLLILNCLLPQFKWHRICSRKSPSPSWHLLTPCALPALRQPHPQLIGILCMYTYINTFFDVTLSFIIFF